MADNKIIAITSGKGGVGKTTTAAGIAHALVKLGKRVLAVDGDLDFRNLDIILGARNCVYNLDDVLNQRCKLSDACIPVDKSGRLYYFAATIAPENTRRIDRAVADGLINHLSQFFDYVIIDTAAGCGRSFELFTRNADMVITVTIPHLAAIRDAEKVVSLLEEGKQAYLVVNMVNSKLISKGLAPDIDTIIDMTSAKLLGLVPVEPKMQGWQNTGDGPHNHEKCSAAEQYEDIAYRITGEYRRLRKFW